MSFATRLHATQSQAFRMGHVISVLQMSGEELDEHLMQTARDNPLLVVRQRRRAAIRAGNTPDHAETGAADAPTSLYDHVLQELAGLIAHGGEMRRLVVALVEELEPTGWLARPVSEIAASLAMPEDLVERGLRLVQGRVTPAGLFARDLRDCLRLQLEDRGLWSPDMAAILTALDAMAHGGAEAVSRATGLGIEVVASHLARLRRLDPKPGTRFATDLTLMREPDVRVEPRGDGWVAILKSNFETQVSILPSATGDNSAGMRDALAQARMLKQALDLRHSALQQIMRHLLDVQGDYFRDGPCALRPLTQSAIAEKTGFHLSTVSRVMNGLLIEGPNGIVEARVLCARCAARSAEGAAPKPRVLSLLRQVLAAESPALPLSDQQLSDLLRSDGLAVSRRVVAKYRQELGFAPAAQRRLRA